ncbi:tyrosine-protein phosphatase non-receptor type substrate 1-like [Trachemys scripta elegans]|uniref:tyrosine-protein phosphatase non-receptor type substrate 1-like n=1 Tax=Trachemys scripta elegans TaxID=31138 RepID=UPI001554D6F2|nr:tyrosine-protein phosphatase non-receptor type substrate 1-like [Trachemys scripta elegans]
MASALTVLLLSCWLAGLSGISGDAGSIPTGETDLTLTGQMSAPICPSSAVPGGIDPTQPGQMSTSTHPSSTEPGRLGSPGQTRSIIAGVSAAAAILLLVAFVCFRKIRARKGSALRLSSTIPMVTLKAPAQQDPVYTSIDKGKQPQTLEPDPGADGLTYAELDSQALQAKRGRPAPAPEPAESSMYAVINVNRGPLQ